MRMSLLLSCLAVMAVQQARAQTVRISEGGNRVGPLTLRELNEGTTSTVGIGDKVPGVDLAYDGGPRHWIGDDSAFAGRSYVDTAWSRPLRSRDSILPGATVHWVRYHLMPETRLIGVPLRLQVQAVSPYILYHNGREIARSGPSSEVPDERVLPATDSLTGLGVPLLLAVDGRAEVLALRLSTPPGTSLGHTGLRVTLHVADVSYRMQRSLLHYGVFIGVNVIILILALMIWWSDRQDRSWPLLALLSLVSALGTVCDVGGDQRALGFPEGVVVALVGLNRLLLAWPMYLLIVVLGVLRGDLTPLRARLYLAGVLLITLVGAAVHVLDVMGLVDTRDGLTFSDISTAIIVLVVFLGLLFAAVFTWFAIEVLRLGIRLLRSRGYERWVGAGAVASVLFTFILYGISEFTGVGLSAWLQVLADYCGYVAVPVSIAVYLAIRSGHHNRLVARQRDDLDAEVKERTAELRTERDRSNELLLNILPQEVADELKAKGSADARHFDQATVLFTDFRGFTQLSEQVGPAELLQELNDCFKFFDAIMEKYRIEKIKTIGDSYMAAGGLPDPHHGSPADVVRAALDMQAFMERHKAEREAAGKPCFEMRVGIHTGPVVAGIVGVKKFQYDIWGDTVNTASRMESSGAVGKVNISEATYALVKDAADLAFTPRGKVQAKGKGEMEMYFVEHGTAGAP